MSWHTPFRSSSDNTNVVPVEQWATPGELEEEDYYEVTWETRVLSHRDAESLGMWAASLKLMAGTQDLLPAVPLASPYTRRRPRDHSLRHPHSYPLGPRPSAPPASPRQPLPASVFLAGDNSARGVIHEASTACNKIMQLACSLERRTNAERRLSRKNHRPNCSSQAAIGRAAPASTPSAVIDDSRCRAATPRPPRPTPADSATLPQLASLDLVGVITACPPLRPSPSPTSDPILVPPPATYVHVATEPIPHPAHCDIAVGTSELLPRCFSDASVDTRDADDDPNTTYGVISDPFARSLARLLPLNYERERRFTRAIYLGDWLRWFEWFNSEHIPPTQRVYLNALAEIFRPWSDPGHGQSFALYLNPVYNLFTHWWSGWNALTFPT